MGTYGIPRNLKGEGRILFIFSTKALIWTAAGAGIGLLFYFLFSMLNLTIVGIIITVLFAVIGFSIATFKMPNSTAFEITRKTGGQNIDDVIKRGIRFKRNKKRIYVYTKEGDIDE